MQEFFAFGYNKSGTTFLQRLLDGHKAVNCPPEHHLTTIVEHLRHLTDSYRAVIEGIDANTARQGVRYSEASALRSALTALVQTFMREGAGPQTTHVGINDNTLGLNLPLFAGLLPGARFIAIVRDPREIAVSLHHHRQRTEPAYQAAGSLDEIAAAVGEAWTEHMRRLSDFQRDKVFAGRLAVARYEDLSGPEGAGHLVQIYGHLGLAVTTEEAAGIMAAVNAGMRRAASPGYLRDRPAEGWRAELTPDQLSAIEAPASAQMNGLGYELAARL